MATPKHCQVTLSWPTEDGRSVDDVVIYNIESDVDDSQMPSDMLDSLTDLFLVSPGPDPPEDSPCPPCTARISSQDLGPGRRLTLAAVDVLSSARNIEVFSHTGEYLTLAEGTRLDVAGERKLFLSQHTFDQPQASCQLKFLSLVHSRRLWLHSLHVTLAVSRVDPAFPMALGPVIDMDKVTAIMADMDTEVPDRAKGLMNAMTSIQRSKKKSVSAFGSILSNGGQGPPTMAGIMGMFASMGMSSSTPPASPQHTLATSQAGQAHNSGQASNNTSKRRRRGKRGKSNNINEECSKAQALGNESSRQKGQSNDQQKCPSKDQQRANKSKDQQKCLNKDQQKSRSKNQQKDQNKDKNKEESKSQNKDQTKDRQKGQDNQKCQSKKAQSKDKQKGQVQAQSEKKQKAQNKGQQKDQPISASSSTGTNSTDTDSEQSGSVETATDEMESGVSYSSGDNKFKRDQQCQGDKQRTVKGTIPVTHADLKALEQRLVQQIDAAQVAILDEITSQMVLSEQHILSRMDSLVSQITATLLGGGVAMNGAADPTLPD